MNYLYTAAEENRLVDAAVAEARRLRGLAAAEFWSSAARWVGRHTHGLVPRVGANAAARPQAKWSKEA
ncbi:MAG: hypothetical protein JF626_12200 [Polaromonas sp.]|nr:hypothetical protein [Polaromonas sp.]